MVNKNQIEGEKKPPSIHLKNIHRHISIFGIKVNNKKKKETCMLFVSYLEKVGLDNDTNIILYEGYFIKLFRDKV